MVCGSRKPLLAERCNRQTGHRHQFGVFVACSALFAPAGARTLGGTPVEQPILYKQLAATGCVGVVAGIYELLPDSTSCIAFTCRGGGVLVRIELHRVLVLTKNALRFAIASKFRNTDFG